MEKVCKQCLDKKQTIDFRKYPRSESTYPFCFECEKVNSREKYLRKKDEKGTITAEEQEELQDIYKLWDYQTLLGGTTPRTHSSSVKPYIKDKLMQYNSIPENLLKMLTMPLVDTPEMYFDTLKKLQMAMPDKYKGSGIIHKTINAVWERLMDYEENYEEDMEHDD